MFNDFHIAKIGKLIVLAIPEVDWVTVILPFPFNGTKQISGTIDHVISVFEEAQKMRDI